MKIDVMNITWQPASNVEEEKRTTNQFDSIWNLTSMRRVDGTIKHVRE